MAVIDQIMSEANNVIAGFAWKWYLLGRSDERDTIIHCKDCKYDHSCTHTMVRKSSGGNIYCPVDYCSEGKRKSD